MSKTSPRTSLRRVTIHFEDDEVRRQSEATAHQLLTAAIAQAKPNDNSAEIAKKALKYRNILDRMEGVDITSPGFDAAKFLGVDWCKIESLKAFCAREDQSDSEDAAQTTHQLK